MDFGNFELPFYRRRLNLLLIAIQGRGAFARFKDALFQIDLLDQWYEHKGRLDRKKALDWLYSEELITQQDIQKGMDHYEELLGQRKQRKIDIDHMIAGTRVRCSDNTGHTDRLTLGTIYEVHDERQNDLLIQIRNDEGNIRWFPKSHFELLKEE